MKNDDYYEVKFGCENCGHSFNKKIPKGKISPRLIMCPNCETRLAKKSRIYWGRK
jgi:transcription elongation factor Elf1